ncbi:MAG: hypothetical protein NT051_03440, partial [Candidatus Micrarchaeota archaeon]|nr:hypothetical protein [Candidatus Micrarchaeota archaeon]
KYAGAIQDFDKAGSILIISPEYDADAAMKLARIYSSRGESHLQCKNYGNAEKDYDYAIMHYRSAMAQSRPGETLDKMTRGLEESYIGAGNVKVELKQFIEAKKCFDEAERLPTATEYRMHAIFANFWVAVEKAGLLEKTSDIKNPWKIKSA